MSNNYDMNWFDNYQNKRAIKSQNKMAKLAANGFDWKNQEGEQIMFGDVSRYVVDSYAVKLFFSKTNKKLAISLMTNHAYLGTAQYSVFWTYRLDEEKRARKTYKELKKRVREVITYFESEGRPTSLFYPTLRKKVQTIDDRDLVRTNIPTINYSYDIDYEADWDKNIYGPRYPTYKEVSFNEYLNSSIYSGKDRPTGKFAL